MSYYFWINLLSVSVPLLVSFDRRLRFYREWKFLFPAMLATMAVFIPWDVFKTAAGVWGFNPRYLQGINLFNLPVEEWLFFIAIPYACLFTYHAFGYLIRKDYLGPWVRSINLSLMTVLILIAVFNTGRTYTFVTFTATALFLALQQFVVKPDYLGRFYLTYLVTLIPFFIVNGALTGSFTPEPVVWYDDSRNLGIRMGTIPVEDSVYGLLLLMMNTTIYEWLKNRKKDLTGSPA